MLCEFLSSEYEEGGGKRGAGGGEEGKMWGRVEEDILVLVLVFLVWLYPKISSWNPGDCTTDDHRGGL